jgi:hypothetical protein
MCGRRCPPSPPCWREPEASGKEVLVDLTGSLHSCARKLWPGGEGSKRASALRTPFLLDEFQRAVAATLHRGTEPG